MKHVDATSEKKMPKLLNYMRNLF